MAIIPYELVFYQNHRFVHRYIHHRYNPFVESKDLISYVHKISLLFDFINWFKYHYRMHHVLKQNNDATNVLGKSTRSSLSSESSSSDET